MALRATYEVIYPLILWPFTKHSVENRILPVEVFVDYFYSMVEYINLKIDTDDSKILSYDTIKA